MQIIVTNYMIRISFYCYLCGYCFGDWLMITDFDDLLSKDTSLERQ